MNAPLKARSADAAASEFAGDLPAYLAQLGRTAREAAAAMAAASGRPIIATRFILP